MKKISRFKTLFRSYIHYMKGSAELPYHPFKLWVEPTNKCPLSCPMCPNSKKPEGYLQGFMDLALYKELISQIRGKVSHINLHHRGESLLHPDLPSMIRLAGENGIRTSIHSNGVLLSKELSKDIIASGLDFLSFSFDGYDKKTYENIRIGADFDNTLNNIKNFLSLKASAKSKTPFSVIEFIDFDYSKEQLNQIIELTERIDCKELDQIIIKKVHNWAGNLQKQTKENNCKRHYSPCTFPYYALTVFFDGSIVPCPQDFFGKLILGNLKESNLLNIWNNEKSIYLRKKFKTREIKDLSPCSECDMIFRRNILGIPASNLSNFLKENLLGFSRSSKKIIYK